MHAPVLALGWELWARNRRGLLAILALLVAECVVAHAVYSFISPGASIEVYWASLWVDVAVYLYLLSVFVYSDVVPGGKASGFPPRLFTLPVSTCVLVGVPMLAGVLTVIILCPVVYVIADAPFVRDGGLWSAFRYSNFEEPAFFLAAYLTCAQALCWAVVRAPLIRIAVLVVGLPSATIGMVFAKLLIPIDWHTYGWSWYEHRAIWCYCFVIICSYAVAVAGVALDRRGDRFDWAALVRWLLRAVPALPAREQNFASPADAQRWLEVRRNAWMLPALVTLFFAVMLWSAVLPFSAADVARALISFLWVPAATAFVAGFSLGKSSFWARDLRLAPLTALRPMSCVALARAKLQAAGVSALLAWGVVLVLAPTWVMLSGSGEMTRTHLTAWLGNLSAGEIALLVPTAIVGLVGLTWLQMVAGMCLSLTGRIGVVNAIVANYAVLAAVLFGLTAWVDFDPEASDTAIAMAWCLGGAVALTKFGTLIWAWKRFGPVPDRTMPRLGRAWLVVAACLVTAIEIGWPSTRGPKHLIALYVVLSLPLTRLVALPAAIAWNRHR
jgi:hypothetical protein